MDKLRIVTISEASFEKKREDENYQGGLSTEYGYKVVPKFGTPQYAYSIDGRGVYWYDTAEEMREQH